MRHDAQTSKAMRCLFGTIGVILGVAGTPSLAQNEPSLYLQSDELIYESHRVIARGRVEVYFNNHILVADRLIYDQSANTLTAEGNAQFKEPNGNFVRADEFVVPDRMLEAFVRSLNANDDTRVSARRSVRRD